MTVSPPVKQPALQRTTDVRVGLFHIEDVYPQVDCGQFSVKRLAGETIDVWADIFRHGHDIISAELIWREAAASAWNRSPMVQHGNDRWTGTFTPTRPARCVYAIEAWTDEFATWKHRAVLKKDAGQNIALDALEGAALVTRARPVDDAARAILANACEAFLKTGDIAVLLDDDVALAMSASQARSDLTRSQIFPLMVDRPRAVSAAWYEMVPRSQGTIAGKHGTFQDCIARLPDIAGMGFDVVYFTPIHPIGRVNRKGRNNALTALPGDPGSPYAIGASEGGHDAVHPDLGTMEDFRALVDAAKSLDMEIALDFAVQCAPDHPWITQHPNWFQRRPDGSIAYAENPPKKYQDIHNPDLQCEDAEALWNALRDVVLFWMSQGVRIFRVDNPHTKSLAFWKWLIDDIQGRDPTVIFLAEAFTRPKLMKGLAKLGFTQSYTYFTWRTEKWEIEQYLRELTGYPEREYYRPNFFVSTPDILPYQLQNAEAWMFKSRVALAATLSATYGVYNGFELIENEPLPGREEYLNSEKYEIKVRDWDKPGNIKDYIRALNTARRSNPALLQTARLRFLPLDSQGVTAFVKHTEDQTNVVVGAIALTADAQEVWLPLSDVQVRLADTLRPVAALENTLTGERHAIEWGGLRVRLDPRRDPAILFRCLA